MKFENSFRTLPSLFFEDVTPTPLSQPELFHTSHTLKKEISLELDDRELLLWLNGTLKMPNEQRIATRYAGHQFGVWAGQLGDGRAISLGELITSGKRYEIQTKGSGITPFSRFGDGKAVIRSTVREYLCSEHMHALGIPTTRALALIIGNDPVQRETVERSALIARVFPSNLRFGHFEYAFHFKENNSLQALVDYSLKYFFKECRNPQEMLFEISKRTAHLMAQWMSVGFCHGVMNTDNMSLLGLTIDYGPFGFMEDFNPYWICNHSDTHGRYSYVNQPRVALWNLDRLLWCFSDLVPKTDLQNVFDSFLPLYENYWCERFRKKLGLTKPIAEDTELIQEFLDILEAHKLDFTFYFRELSELVSMSAEPSLMDTIWAPDYWQNWIQKYRSRILLENTDINVIKTLIQRQNPKFVLRNYIAQEIIQSVENNDKALFEKWFYILTHPYDDHPDFDHYSKPPIESAKNLILSCSS